MKKPLLLLVPAAFLLLASCSSEPSDWRPEQKVSLDLVPPGTRVSDNFDQNTSAAPNDAKGGAISSPSPMMSSNLERRTPPSAGGVMSADTKPENARKRKNSSTSSQSDTTASGHEAQR